MPAKNGSSAIAMLALIAIAATVGAWSGPPALASEERSFFGIDPDVYQMPLYGEYIQCRDGLIPATTAWSSYPPETFNIDFLRFFWAYGMDAAQQAQTEAAAYYFVFTHHGPPAAPAADLSEVAIPSDFSGEVFSCLDSRTTRIEFEVPKTDFEKLGWDPIHLDISIPADPNPGVPWKLRGWYIKGDGIYETPSHPVHPLIILSPGFPYSIAYDQLVGEIDVGRQVRKMATYLVSRGFDILIFDKRGIGYSEGIVDGMGEDIFRVLDQLERGEIVEEGIELTLSIITTDGRRLTGAAAAAENLLGEGYTARTKPIVLRGFSYGSSQLQKAMAMNYSDLPVEYRFTRDSEGNVVVDAARMPAGSRGYNFRGIIAISGFQGSLKYETVPYFVALDALASTVGHNGGVLKSSVYESMDRWPAFLGLYGTIDFETADGAIEAFNERLRGFKEIQLVTGYHFGLASEEVDTYFAEESDRFARRAIFGTPPMNDDRTTTYAEEVCSSERVVMDPTTQSIVDVPSNKITVANRRVSQTVENWARQQ